MVCRWVIILVVALAPGALPAWAQGLHWPVGETETVSGYGRSIDEAKRDALAKGLETVQERLHAHVPPLDAWEPTLADVERLGAGAGPGGQVGTSPGSRHAPQVDPDCAFSLRGGDGGARPQCAANPEHVAGLRGGDGRAGILSDGDGRWTAVACPSTSRLTVQIVKRRSRAAIGHASTILPPSTTSASWCNAQVGQMCVGIA